MCTYFILPKKKNLCITDESNSLLLSANLFTGKTETFKSFGRSDVMIQVTTKLHDINIFQGVLKKGYLGYL